jgi:hypothetical protein
MIKAVVLGLALCAGLTACGPQNADQARNTVVEVGAVGIDGKAIRCLPKSDIQIMTGSYELTGDLRRRFLTPAADSAGIRVFIGSSTVSDYGSQTINYTNSSDSCIVFSEGISAQEFSQRLGLNPLGISPFYEPDATPKVSATEKTPATPSAS